MYTPPRSCLDPGETPGPILSLDPDHPLLRLAAAINWQEVEAHFKRYYSRVGAPAKPARLMLCLLILQRLYGLANAAAVAQWRENPYWQRFCGIEAFTSKFPCSPSLLSQFRKRIGLDGLRWLFRYTIGMHGEDAREREILVDTTTQPQAIARPSDLGLSLKIIAQCRRLAAREGLKLRRSYRREVARLNQVARFDRSAQGRARAREATGEIAEIARKLTAELARKLARAGIGRHDAKMALFAAIVNREKGTPAPVHSLHDPEVKCLPCRKPGRRWEFGSRVSLAVTSRRGVIVDAMLIRDNRADSRTLADVLDRVDQNVGRRPGRVIADRGYRGHGVTDVEVVLPKRLPASASRHAKRIQKRRCWRRNMIECVNSHAKWDFGLARNRYCGLDGMETNMLLAAIGYNLNLYLGHAGHRRLARAA